MRNQTPSQTAYQEHLLAEKAQAILQHKQQLIELQEQKKSLQRHKPTTQKDQLSYVESLQLGERIKSHQQQLHQIELHIQKIIRELSALKIQAKKLLPVTGIKVKVSTVDTPVKTFCIKRIEAKETQSEDFKVEAL